MLLLERVEDWSKYEERAYCSLNKAVSIVEGLQTSINRNSFKELNFIIKWLRIRTNMYGTTYKITKGGYFFARRMTRTCMG